MESDFGVTGAGVIEVGVAQAMAQSGLSVVLIDAEQSILDRAMVEIRTSVRMLAFYQRDAADVPTPEDGAR